MNSIRSLDYWRSYFGTANANIFSIIDHAIMVAALDCPNEFRQRRASIAEHLFSCEQSTRWSRCDRVDNDDSIVQIVSSSNGSSDEEIEALLDDIDHESQLVEEVFRIKRVLLNAKEESESALYESLERLQLMELNVDLLKATEIGNAVNPLRKHRSKGIGQLARTIISGWKEMVDEWLKVATPIIPTGLEGTLDSVKPTPVDEEEGLPTPPMDEGALFSSELGSLDLSQFFDGMDDDGNPQQSGEFNKNCISSDSIQIAERKPFASYEGKLMTEDNTSQQAKKNEANDSLPDCVPKPTTKGDMKPKKQPKIYKSFITNNQQVNQQDKFKYLDEAVMQVKLEDTKRKLREQYQEVENVKRQRRIQVIGFHDLPQQGVSHQNTHVKIGNHKRQLARGQR